MLACSRIPFDQAVECVNSDLCDGVCGLGGCVVAFAELSDELMLAFHTRIIMHGEAGGCAPGVGGLLSSLCFYINRALDEAKIIHTGVTMVERPERKCQSPVAPSQRQR